MDAKLVTRQGASQPAAVVEAAALTAHELKRIHLQLGYPCRSFLAGEWRLLLLVDCCARKKKMSVDKILHCNIVTNTETPFAPLRQNVLTTL